MEHLHLRYFECLDQLSRRQFSLPQRRLVEAVLRLSYRRGRADVRASLIDLAAAAGTTKGNLLRELPQLLGSQVLGREDRNRSWWILPPALWQIGEHVEASAALDRVAQVDEQRRAQGDLIPPPISDAEWIATQEGSQGETLFAPEGSQGETLFSPRVARAQEPGTRPEPDQRGRGWKRGNGLDADQWKLLRELEGWCSARGETCNDQQRKNWGWRVWQHPLQVAWSLRQALRHVADGKPVVSRFGLVKHFWHLRQSDDNFREPPPRSANHSYTAGDALAPPAGGVHTSGRTGGKRVDLVAQVEEQRAALRAEAAAEEAPRRPVYPPPGG